MTERFRNKYRAATTRLYGYDYTRNGAYFVTICTRKKIPSLGIIVDNKMILSDIGEMVKEFWLEVPIHSPNVSLDEFIIMPDHIHGIIIIKPIIESRSDFSTIGKSGLVGSTIKNSGNKCWKSKSIGSILNQFKRICTLKTKLSGLDLSWQPRYYDHVIRSDNELDRIREYIKDNPKKWTTD